MVREKPYVPSTKLFGSLLELVVEDVDWLSVRIRFIPGVCHHVRETWHLGLEGLETEGARFSQATLIGNQQRAMI